jgi:hypothetical protein
MVVDFNFVVFGLQMTLSLLAYILIAAWFVAPRLAKLPLYDALLALRSLRSSWFICFAMSL